MVFLSANPQIQTSPFILKHPVQMDNFRSTRILGNPHMRRCVTPMKSHIWRYFYVQNSKLFEIQLRKHPLLLQWNDERKNCWFIALLRKETSSSNMVILEVSFIVFFLKYYLHHFTSTFFHISTHLHENTSRKKTIALAYRTFACLTSRVAPSDAAHFSPQGIIPQIVSG
jgi:hypothetical protein